MSFSKETKKKILDFKNKLEPSHIRAQCVNMYHFDFAIGETIADRIKRDHRSEDGALRAATILVEAGCAKAIEKGKHEYPRIIFEDGSEM